MDVRCERCKARYAIPDEQITAEGLVIRCTACGHAFRIRKKELLVTVAVSGEEAALAIPAHEMVAGFAPPPVAAQARPVSLILRSVDGVERPVADLATLQRWIAERRAMRDDELSRDGGPYLRLGLLPDLAAILGLVEAADRAARLPARVPSPDPFGRAGLDEPPVQPTIQPTTQAPARPPPAPRDPFAAQPVETAAAPAPDATRSSPARAAEPLDDTELASVGKKRGRARLLAGGALLAALGAAAWFFQPAEVAGPLPNVPAPDPKPPAERSPAPNPSPAPTPAPTEAAPPARAPAPTPTEAAPPSPAPTPAEAAPPSPAPTPAEAAPPPPTEALPTKPDAAPKKAASPKVRLAQARALRDRGETARALDAYQKLLREEPDNVEALNGRGLCYFELNQYGSAAASFQQALVIAPDDPDATMGLAETYRQTGKRAEAAALYQRYLDAHPDGEEAAVARNALSQLKE